MSANDSAELMTEMEDPIVGVTIAGRYCIGELIGVGGWSKVYRAVQPALGRTVAFKLLRADLVANAERIKRFDAEARLLSGLGHAHICSVFDCGILESGQPYLVLEYVEGKSLAHVLEEEESLEPARAVRLLKQMANAMQLAHDKGIVHRDFKPGNLMVIGTGATESVKIIDFGLSRAFDDLDREQLTQTGMTVGTPCYMSPEQVCGQQLDARSDIYSFGCVGYEILTGRKPIAGDSLFETMQAHLDEEPPPMTNPSREIPQGLQDLTMCCLRKDRDERYQSMTEVERALASFEQSGAVTKPKGASLGARLAKARRNFVMPRWGMAVVPVVVGLCLVPFLYLKFVSPVRSAAMQKFVELRKNADVVAAESYGKKLFTEMEGKGHKPKADFVALCSEMQRLYIENNRHREAIPFIKAELDARLSGTSPNSDEYVQAYNDAANGFLAINDIYALPYVQKWADAAASKYGRESRQYCEALENLAWCKFRAGKAAESEKDHLEFVKLAPKFFGSSSKFYLRGLQHLAVVQLHLRKYAHADATCDIAVPMISEDTPGDVQRDLLQAAAHAAQDSHKYDKAIALYRKALAASEKVSLTQADVIASDLALCLVEAKQYADAEPALKDAMKRIAKRWGSESDLYQLLLGKYGEMQRATNRGSGGA